MQSATLIDALRGTTFRLSAQENSAHISAAAGGEAVQMLDDLGYRASDLLQSNCADHWDDPLSATIGAGASVRIDKVRVAQEVTTASTSMWPLDLKDRPAELIALIRHAND